jgi:predicted nucleic acid-binding Zn ribbon protein
MPKAIGELIPGVIRSATAKHQALFQLQRHWKSLVGTRLAAHTKPVSFRRGILRVHTDDPGASFLLSLEKPKLLQRLREATGSQISDMVVRAGEV